MKNFRIAFGKDIFNAKIVFIIADTDYEAQSKVMDKYNIPRGWIISTAWHNTIRVAQ
jgi:hypothetical protein|tara:strand:+ start:2186 stop:2356 length:171 start_codon:yes stop_codon:yes gene_type:complete